MKVKKCFSKMQTIKILGFNLLLILLIGCRENIKKQHALGVSDTIKIEKAEHLPSKFNYLEKLQNKSFVISCGSGCAMTYVAKQIIKNGTSFKVKFEVEMYIDTNLSDTYNETYLFTYNKYNHIDKILLEGTKQNALETLPTSAQKTFRAFSECLIKL